MNGQIFGARGIVKARGTGLDAFESPSLAVRPARRPLRRAAGGGTPKVDILPGYAGAPADLIGTPASPPAPEGWCWPSPATAACRRPGCRPCGRRAGRGVAIVRGSRAAGP